MNVTVFLSSRDGKNPIYKDTSVKLGRLLAQSGHTLVYGGSKEGCMGMVSDSVIQNKGQVIAVYPAGVLPLEPPRQNASKLYLTNDMAERKRKLIDLGEAFVILAGGFGTLEESFQLLTEMSINQTRVRPVIFVGQKFYQPLFDLLRLQLKEGMISKEVIDTISLVDSAEETIELLGDLKLEQVV
ncbi:TIGR00730 family Rossman fold protein [Lactococcus sp.]|uniref:LOG family protein n=1 Tax=Lactococcus sp. TaxID=44273 RepID=UPI002FC643C9